MTPDEYRRLIEEHANEIGRDPAEALGEFSDVLSQMTGARNESEKLFTALQELGLQYSWYLKGEPYDPEKLLSREELGRRYAGLKAQHRAVKKTLSVRCSQLNALLGGGIFFRQGRPVGCETVSARSEPTRLGDHRELVVLVDPDDDEPIFLELLS